MSDRLTKDEPRVVDGRAPQGSAAAGAGPTLRAASVLSGIVAVMMAAAAGAGLFAEELYRDGAWAREAFRGADLVTLVLAVPLLIGSLILSVRGSRRGQVVWIGLLGYAVYNYAYGVFGAEFNDVFLLHIAILSMSLFALACALPSLAARWPARPRAYRADRWIGSFLVVVGVAQGGLWVALVLRYAFTGRLLNDIPTEGQHLVFGLDLALLVPTLVLAGVLLFRRRPIGTLLGSAVCVFGAVYQINLMMAGMFQENAGVAGVKAFPLESLVLTGAFLIAAAAMLRRSGLRASEETI
jgi:hypothetical protein